jgi:hypothetical protein
MTVRANVGDECPNGCTAGYGTEEHPVLIEYAIDAPGAVEGPEGQLLDNDGEMWCPACWDYMGNDQADRQRAAKPLGPMGPDDAPHCRSHIVFRSECERCRSEREFG